MLHPTLSSALTSIALGVSAVAAFQGTSPFVVRSSVPHSRETLDAAESIRTAAVMPAAEVYASLDKIGCSWDAILVSHVKELHYSSILPYTEGHQTLLSVPYLTEPSYDTLREAIQSWASKCSLQDGHEKEVKFVVEDDNNPDPDLDQDYELFVSQYSNHLLVLSGDPVETAEPSKRQLLTPTEADIEEELEELLEDEQIDAAILGDLMNPSSTNEEFASALNTEVAEAEPNDEEVSIWDNEDGYYDLVASSKPRNGTTSLLQHAQIFTTPIITALLVSFGIFIPILGLGIMALVGIQVPPHLMKIAKTQAVSQQKKDQ